MTQYKYTVTYEQAEEGVYLARIPALNGFTTEGETLEEAKEMAKDAVKCYIETCRKKGLPIPEEDTFHDQPLGVEQLAVSF